MTAPILNGYLMLADNRGNALSGHTLSFYYPGTATPKPLWLDRARTQPAANPLTIDASGRVQVYGSGLYRQVLRTQAGQVVWDGETSCADETVSPLATQIGTIDVPADVPVITTSGFHAPGIGAARYVRLAASPPTHEIAAGLGFWLFQSNNNSVWWRLAEDMPTDLMFGVRASASATYAAGAMTVTGPDDTVPLQAAINFALYFGGKGRVLRLPAGLRRITDTIHIGYGDRYLEWTIKGDRAGGYETGGGYELGIFATFIDRPAINIQGARRSTLKNVTVFGPNHGWLYANYNAITDRRPRAAWRGPQAAYPADNRFAPAAGIAVDGYGGVRQASSSYPDVTYPSFTGMTAQYDKGLSSHITFEGVTCHGFQVGTVVQPNLMPVASNGDFIRWVNCDLSFNEIAVSVSHSDARSFAFERCMFHFCHTKFDSLTFGQRSGNVSAQFADCTFDNCYQALNVNLGLATQRLSPSIIYINPYCEALYRLGVARIADGTNSYPGSVQFTGGTLAFHVRSGETTPASYLDGLGEISLTFNGVNICGTYGLLPTDCELAGFRGSFSHLAQSAFDTTTVAGQRAMSVTAGLAAASNTGPIVVRPYYAFGFGWTSAGGPLVNSDGWDPTLAKALPLGSPIPLATRSVGTAGLCHAISGAPQQLLDRAVHPLTGLQQAGIEWSFTCSLGFLADPAHPAYAVGAGDIVHDLATGHRFYVKTASFSGTGAGATASLTLRQISGVYSLDAITWTSGATLNATSGLLRFHCARRVFPGLDRRLMLVTQAGSAEADLVCPGAEAGPAGQLSTTYPPLLQAGDYLLASTTDSLDPEQSVFPRARIVSISTVTGHVVFDTPARRSGTFPSPLFVKAD